MGLMDAMKRALGLDPRDGASRQSSSAETHEHDTRPSVTVPEATSGELLAVRSDNAGQPLMLDIREHYERAQALIPGSVHIPMNSLPQRLAELDPAQDIVVYCAHGNRSYGVTGWLIQQGYKARSLKGGIAEWQQKHGPIERGQGRS